MRRLFNPNLLAAAVIMTAIILYGSLYPFVFREPAHGLGPLRTLLDSWASRPRRGDFLSNILLYMPIGFFGLQSLRPQLNFALRLFIVVCFGAALSVSIELAQYYDQRFVSAQDVYANTLGTIIGAIIGSTFGPQWRSPLLRDVVDKPFPSLILAAWIAYQLYPYVPSVDVHEKWLAVKPLFVAPSLAPYDLFRYTVSWALICALLEAIVGQNRALRLFPIFALGFLAVKFMIINRTITWAQLLGAAAAGMLWSVSLNIPARIRMVALCGLLGAYVLTWRLEPFHFAGQARAFGWIPFGSLMQGSIEVNVLSFLEKVFYYGGLIWALTRAGARLRTAAISVALLLLLTSIMEIYLPGRSADTTDAAMALITAAVAALLMRSMSRSTAGNANSRMIQSARIRQEARRKV